ncbi:genetic suppressor element 1 [Plakobranchus ocellatus]|uniref:Genetic suppressor element 1 n=1 Tax=Plakobranchus ocellatus TaxID=259542 RepID=A0AAV4CSP4_9GAST|nr:genetic suppressor element 1 [Plakobranchus ocellatus]
MLDNSGCGDQETPPPPPGGGWAGTMLSPASLHPGHHHISHIGLQPSPPQQQQQQQQLHPQQHLFAYHHLAALAGYGGSLRFGLLSSTGKACSGLDDGERRHVLVKESFPDDSKTGFLRGVDRIDENERESVVSSSSLGQTPSSDPSPTPLNSRLSASEVGGAPSASKPLIPVPGSPHTEMGKVPPKTATVPPLNHHAGSNTAGGGGSNSNAPMRTSGFAAALRKLAHQAKDSSDDPSLKQTSSPPDNHSPRDLTHKVRGQGSAQLSFPSWPLSSAPVVTIAPTQTHAPAHQHHRGRNHDRLPSALSGNSSSYEHQQHHSHPQHPHHRDHLQQQQQQHHHHHSVSPSSKLDGREANSHHHRQTPLSSHAREDDRGSRSSSRVTPQAATSPPTSSSFNLSSQSLASHTLTNPALSSHGLTREALDLYARGFPGYRPEDEALARLGLAGLPYGIDPAAYAAYAAAAAAYHPALLQQQAALAAHSPYRFDDPLLLERYRLLQASSPYLPFPGLAGLSSLAGLGLHPTLAAAAAAAAPQFPGGSLPPPELLQRYPHPYLGAAAAAAAGAGQQHRLLDPLLDPRLAMLERSRLEEEKVRELQESERGRDERRKQLAANNSSSSSSKRESREPGEREPTRHHSHDSRSAGITESSAACYDRTLHGFSSQEAALQRQLLDQREGKGQAPHLQHDHKSYANDRVYRDSRAHHQSPKDPYVRPEATSDSYSRRDVGKDSQRSSKYSPHNSYTHIIKPYDRMVDQQLSQGDSAVSGRRVHDSLQDRQGKPSVLGVEPSTPTGDRLQPQLLSPTLQRPWSSASSASSSSHHNHRHPHHHHYQPQQQQQQHSTPVAQPSKERSSSDFFRPFDDHVDKGNTRDLRQTPEVGCGRERGEDPRVSSVSSLPSPHHYSQTLVPESSTNCSPYKSPFSANILSVPSVKVHPQPWVPLSAPHSSNPHQMLSSSPTPLSSSLSSTFPSSSSVTLPSREGPPPLLPTLQPSAMVSEITPTGDNVNTNPFMPTITRFITDRIERFDFKSLARECTASAATDAKSQPSTDPSMTTANPKHPVSKLDRREAAFKVQKRKRRLGLDAESLTSSFILSGEECGDEEEESMMTRLTMLTRASPIPLDDRPAKLNLLEYLGLTTGKRKRELEEKKERRRRRKLRMASLSPVRHNVDTTEVFVTSPKSPITVASFEAPHNGVQAGTEEHSSIPEEKATFLVAMGLRPLPGHKKTELSQQRKLVAHLRKKNGFGKMKGDQHLPVEEEAAAPEACNFLDKSPFHQQYLISAGLATEVRSLQASHPETDLGNSSAVPDLGETRPGVGLLHRSRETGVSVSGLGAYPSLFYSSNLPSQDGPPVQHRPPASKAESAPVPSKCQTVQHLVDEAAPLPSSSSSPSSSALEVPPTNFSLSRILPLQQQPSRLDLPTAAVSGQSQALDINAGPVDGESRYRLLQASSEDMEEAASRMNRHLARWADKLTAVDQRNDSVNTVRGKLTCEQHKPL